MCKGNFLNSDEIKFKFCQAFPFHKSLITENSTAYHKDKENFICQVHSKCQ